MGEWSKKVGERGEKIVADFLGKIGWTDYQNGIELPCVLTEEHKRQTHGIDFLFSYETPLSSATIDNLVISAKFTSLTYSTSDFKDHISDLANTIACFKRSQIRQETNNNFHNVEKARDIGVLFWFSNNRDGYNNIIERLSNVRLPEDLSFEYIFLVDNKKAAFIYDSISYIKRRYNDYDIQFFYPNTGNNPNTTTKQTSGTILPVEYINASVLPIRIESETNEVTLALLIEDNFEKESLKRLMGLGQNLTSNWASKILIAFPDYDELIHGNEVKSIKTYFKDKKYTERVQVTTYSDDFRG